MAQEIPWEIREQAEELYIIDGLTFEAVADKLDVAVNTLKNWAKAEGWKARRREFRGTRRQIEEKTQKLRVKLIDDALTPTGNPQAAYAFAHVERLVIEKARKKAIEDAADVVEETARQRGADEEEARFWREKVLGVK